MDKVTEEKVKWLQERGYKLATRSEFEAAGDLPDGLLKRAQKIAGIWVVYDPHDDDDGFLLIGDNREALVLEAWSMLDSYEMGV